ncbi:MAG TPA: MarR family winged helix-turn-helix transcriptional regulator [Eoetvoesiella sp.]
MKTNIKSSDPVASGAPAGAKRKAAMEKALPIVHGQQQAANNAIPAGLEPYEEQSAAYLLRQVAERLANSLTQSLRPFKQSTSVYRVLIALTRRNPATMRELIELTLIEPSTLSRTVARMAQHGLITCSPVEGDARALLVTVTDTGLAQLDAILPAATAQYEWAVHNVPQEELEAMRLTLQKMLRNLKISPIK